MKVPPRWRFTFSSFILALTIVLVAVIAAGAQNPDRDKAQDHWSLVVAGKTFYGVAHDWTYHNSVFSDPGPEETAIANGTHDRWLKVVNNPRYLMQQLYRRQPARGPYAGQVAAIEAKMKVHDASAPAANPAPARQMRPMPPALSEPKNFEQMEARLRRFHRPKVARTAAFGSARKEGFHEHGIPGHDVPARGDARIGHRITWPTLRGIPANLGQETAPALPGMPNHDWSIGSATAPTGAYRIPSNTYPAKWGLDLNTASCASDFVVYPTGNYGTTTQATMVAYNNLYSGCGGTVPSVYWAYNTGSAAVTLSPILNVYDGGEVAFVQYSSAGANPSSLVLLKWQANDGTLSAPVAPNAVAPALFPACAAPCMTSIGLAGGFLDYWSQPYYDFGSDTLYVGDSGGYLHKFFPVFNGVLAEVTAGAWPILLDSGYSIASPVDDEGTNNIFVGDTYGYLYAITPAGAVTSALWGYYVDYGFYDGPLVDNTALAQYFFLTSFLNTADDNVYNAVLNFYPGAPCPPCTTDNLIALPGVMGPSADAGVLYSGAFDNIYFSSSNWTNPSGNLYVMGNTNGIFTYEDFTNGYPGTTLFQIPIAANVVTGNNIGNAYGYNEYGYGDNGPLSEFYNSSAGTDYLFATSEDDFDFYGYAYIPNCYVPGTCDVDYGALYGCAMSFDAAAFGAAQSPLGEDWVCGYANTAATGGYIIDNSVGSGVLPGASQAYIITTWAGSTVPCATSGNSPCDVQVPQAGP
jgi:hypothetical protein